MNKEEDALYGEAYLPEKGEGAEVCASDIQIAAHEDVENVNISNPNVTNTEENYARLEKEEIDNYMKYPSWYREHKGDLKPYEKASFEYREEEDVFICPQKRRLLFVDEKQVKTASGYEKTERRYECESCADCPVKSCCHSKEGNRHITHSLDLGRYQKEARDNLSIETGTILRKRRSCEIETVFGHIKHNMGIRRFHLRGLKKVTLESILIVLGHNLTRLVGRIESEKIPWNPLPVR